MAEMKDVLVAVTGASGSIYADRLLRFLAPRLPHIGLIISPEAGEIAAREMDWAVDLDTLQLTGVPEEVRKTVRLYRPDDFQAHYASGSAAPDAMIIIPCTIGSLGYIAAGLNDNLIHRAAGVCLKERRPLVLVVRESPLSLVDLRNMSALAEAGATIMPASPSFYAGPKDVAELIDFFAIRVLDQIGVHVHYPGRWGPG
jgi:4-hydroxy-3-polyprenylbenzoate decarboxylase